MHTEHNNQEKLPVPLPPRLPALEKKEKTQQTHNCTL